MSVASQRARAGCGGRGRVGGRGGGGVGSVYYAIMAWHEGNSHVSACIFFALLLCHYCALFSRALVLLRLPASGCKRDVDTRT